MKLSIEKYSSLTLLGHPVARRYVVVISVADTVTQQRRPCLEYGVSEASKSDEKTILVCNAVSF